MKRICIFLLCLPLFLSLGAQVTYPANIYADTLHAPFLHGVASGDPLADAVILWTRVTPVTLPSAALDVHWEVSSTQDFAVLAASGIQTTDSTGDWTVKVDATGLLPYTTYYYRFYDDTGKYSVTGRTRTAPAGPIDLLRIAAGSCSSIWSGFYNAYRRVGERNDLDLFIQAGDYIYDYADADELIRMPVPDFPDPANLKEWRDLHAYNCLDPDFRYAKQRLPFVIIWDNHDLDSPDSASLRQAIRAFHEWTPTRLPDPGDSLRMYRTLHYGDLLDIIMMDAQLYEDNDTLPDGQPGYIGNQQYAWLRGEFSSSTANWKILESQKMMGQFLLTGLPGWIPFGDGEVMDSSAWDGYGGERARILNFLDSAGINNTIVVSGDAHISVVQDIDPDPTNAASYNGTTGAGAVAVEFLPASISRGNLDEMGLGFVESILISVTDGVNPHHLHKEFHSHGYGIIDIRPDSAVAEFWYSGILSLTSTETFAGGWVVKNGENHWRRTPTSSPTDTSTVGIVAATPRQPLMQISPNPATESSRLSFVLPVRSAATIQLVDAAGRICSQWEFAEGNGAQLQVRSEHLPPGEYVFILRTANESCTLKWLVQ